ncbi:hypothetical protein FSP39_003150 [Pinctada imbricata]|uniref:G-protein coupled receptors family 1 profile domain-containing protein n=1 Tax=Pinctada imbricata TaxID=66713 RepID=A0AA89BYI4_PINIB|nr:hypothetical protein FSP39_003150 [Pinctada imbricata]
MDQGEGLNVSDNMSYTLDLETTSAMMPRYIAQQSTPLQTFVMNANRYMLPVIIVTGFLGNTMSFMVFIFTSLKRISTSVYLAALAVSDTGFLLCVWVGWFDNMGIHFFHNDGICQIVVYMTFVFSFTSVWFVNALTTEMYICVFHPSKAATVCRPKFSRNMVFILVAFAAVFYIFSFWTANVHNTKCQFLDHAETMMILSILDTFLTLIFPFSMIIFMITRLLLDISRLYKNEEGQTHSDNEDDDFSGDSSNMETMITETSFSGNCNGDANHHTASSSSSPTTRRASHSRSIRSQGTRAQTKIKRMLVVVVLVFLILNLPSHAIRVQFFIRSLIDKNYKTTTNEFLLQQIFQILYYLNFAINFVLYSVAGKTFRTALINFPRRICDNRCKGIKLECLRFTRMTSRKDSGEDYNNQQHSRLVDIHLSAIQLSQVPSFDTEYVHKSPPCLLSPDSTAL